MNIPQSIDHKTKNFGRRFEPRGQEPEAGVLPTELFSGISAEIRLLVYKLKDPSPDFEIDFHPIIDRFDL